MSAAAPPVRPLTIPHWARESRTGLWSGAAVLVAADFTVVAACYLAAWGLRVGALAALPGLHVRGEAADFENYILFVLIYLLVFSLAGLYHRRVSSIEESVVILRACFYATTCALMVSFAAHISQLYSRATITLAAALTAMALPAARYLVKSALGRWGEWQRPVVLIGVNANGLRAAHDLAADRTTGYRVIGIFAGETFGGPPPPWPVWRVDQQEAIALCRERGLRHVILCERAGGRGELQQCVRELEEFASEIKIAAADDGLHSWRINSEVLRSSYLLDYRNPLTGGANRILKRVLDLVAGAGLCLLFAPAFLAIPLLIKVTSRGPVFFRHPRLGRAGRSFECLKFRTMHAGADRQLARMMATDGAARREFAATQKLRNDPRITRLGAWLRRTSLDELPQLWNVLRGEMSLVGPRPIVSGETAKYDVELTNYFRVPCGLTGLWQTSGRSDLSYSERVRLDVFYIRNWSIWLDLVILARTAAHLLRPRGAY